MTITTDHSLKRYRATRLHDELGVVMAKAWQQLSGPPLQEVVEGVGGILLHQDLISVAPDLQTGQRDPDVQRTVELKGTQDRRLGSSFLVLKRSLLEGGQRSEVSPSPPGWPRPSCGTRWSCCSSDSSETEKHKSFN